MGWVSWGLGIQIELGLGLGHRPVGVDGEQGGARTSFFLDRDRAEVG